MQFGAFVALRRLQLDSMKTPQEHSLARSLREMSELLLNGVTPMASGTPAFREAFA